MKVSESRKLSRNPFLDGALESIRSIKRRRSIMPAENKDAILSLVDRYTGEVAGDVKFVAYTEVDPEPFVKLYYKQGFQLGDLNTSALRVLVYIMHQMKPNSDTVEFYLPDCKNHTGYKTSKPIYAGLRMLQEAGFIHRGPVPTTYFINPLVLFNGNRAAYLKKQKPAFSEQLKPIRISPSAPSLDELDRAWLDEMFG
ncbi:replication/maintenance protein RepL [Hymenobacter edaphi]|nr:replication/maintenance protein RepL [Hymenobacter edaphi]